MPLHLRASELVKSSLYTGLASFDELENRIAALGDDKRKGDAFEVFAEAYLATQRKHDAEKVWPLSAIPLEVLRRLGLYQQDFGVDGVFLNRALSGFSKREKLEQCTMKMKFSLKELAE